MKEKEIFDAITDVRQEYIEEAAATPLKKQSIAWKKWTAIAACAVLMLGIGSVALLQNRLPLGGNSGAGGSGHGEGSIFMSYAGPLFPLTLAQADNDISATRSIAYDFALANKDNLRVWGTEVSDSYTLYNDSAMEKTVTAIYPFASSFQDLEKLMPTVTVGGQEIVPSLYAGGYSGGFTGVSGEEQGSLNLAKLDSWEGYKTLLQDGSYQAGAFGEYPVLSMPVTVYTFTDFEAPTGEYPAATQAISFTIDPNKTTILSYGFNGGELGENGFRRYSYFVPDNMRRETEAKVLIVIGDDIGDYTLQGYKNGACEGGNELEGVSATVTRSEAVLSDVLDLLVTDFFRMYGEDNSLTVSQEMFSGAVSEFMLAYGLLSESGPDRYQWGRMDDMISEALSFDRVMYLSFEVTIPAGGAITVKTDMHKQPSFDFTCTGSDNVGVQGYDMVTRLGSNLTLRELTAELINTDLIEIVRQNCGFDLANDIDRVTLDLTTEHYYFEIRTADRNE